MTMNEARQMYLKDLYSRLDKCEQSDDFSDIMDYLHPNHLVKSIENGSNRLIQNFGLNQNHYSYDAILSTYQKAYDYANEILPVWIALSNEVGRSNLVSWATKGIMKFFDIRFGGKLFGKITGFGYLVRFGDGDKLGYHWDQYNSSFIAGVEYDFEMKIWKALLEEFGR